MSETEQVRAEIEDIRARSDDLADVFDGVSEGVPMVGNVGKTRSENEVFIPDTLHCTVLVKTTDATYMGRTFKRIYRLGVNSAEAPLKKKGGVGIFRLFAGQSRTGPYRRLHRSGRAGQRSRRSGIHTVTRAAGEDREEPATGGELKEFWNRAKRRMVRREFEKLRPPSNALQ